MSGILKAIFANKRFRNNRLWCMAMVVGLLAAGVNAEQSLPDKPAADKSAPAQLRIVTTIKPLALIARDIGGERVMVDQLIPANSSPHDFSLRMSDRRRLASADILLWVDDQLEPFMARLASKAAGIQVSTLAGIVNAGENSHAGHQHQAGRDPHYWLNPRNGILVAGALAKQLAELDPDHAESYRAASERFHQKLTHLDELARTNFAPLRLQAFAVQHDAYGHLVAHFDLRQQGALRSSTGAKAGARTVAALLNSGSVVACVLADPQFDSVAAERLAERLQVPLLWLDPLAGDLVIGTDNYHRFIGGVVDTLTQCLEGRYPDE